MVSRANFSTWFKQTAISQWENGRVIISVPNAFTLEWLKKKYHDPILKAMRSITHDEVLEVYYKVESINQRNIAHAAGVLLPANAPFAAAEEAPAPATSPSGLNARYIFESFIVGKGNELAHAAAQSVAASPGKAYNPLFIYGGVGLGKTHLLQAIGHHILAGDPTKKVLYVTCERFTNEYIHAVRSGKGKEFKDTYRGVDLLLVDDIQFMTGKEGTQEEFFHTFNVLHQAHKQIVVTSDRPPKSIAALEARLVSRFEWGMIADIAQPDQETRVAILEAKCREKNIVLPVDILQYIAAIVQSNVRELEGALNRLMAYAQLNKAEPTLESAKALLQSLSQGAKRGGLTPRALVAAVAQFFDVPVEGVLGISRKKELVEPRQIAMYLLREELHSSFPAIGHELGGRDHTTAMHACTKISAQILHDEKLKQDVALIKQRLFGN